jgi:hypothetical protein
MLTANSASLGACEPVFTFNLLQDLLETQTISSCSHIFSWVESRTERLTEGMVPSKGKALILLRTLNDLLRRLSKMGSTTMFCGRISTFLSGVFPLGERSGVNLRGEYGPLWDGVVETPLPKPEDVVMDAEESAKVETTATETTEEADKMNVDESATLEKKENSTEGTSSALYPFMAIMLKLLSDAYATFWSLQYPFSRPSLLAGPGKFDEFKENVAKVLPVIKEATVKERAMMGSKGTTGSGSSKRKRESETPTESQVTDYFFTKFLTSPELLELEASEIQHIARLLANIPFRLQIPTSDDKFSSSCSFS